jgi:hypothetical protein
VFFGRPSSSFVASNGTLQQASARPCSSGWNRRYLVNSFVSMHHRWRGRMESRLSWRGQRCSRCNRTSSLKPQFSKNLDEI